MAKYNGKQALGIKGVCNALIRRRIISHSQAKEILSKEPDIRNKLEKMRSIKRGRGVSAQRAGCQHGY